MSKHPHILVVDDEDAIANMIAEALRDEDYTVLTAYDGRQGLELARQHTLDLILTDVMMPYLDGLKMAELLLQEFGAKTPPIIFMSAVDCRNQIQSLGTFLFKPFTLETLLDVVESQLG